MSEEDREERRKQMIAINASMTPEEKAEASRRGAYKSHEVRRRKRDLKIIAKEIINMRLSKREKRQLKELGVTPEEVSDCKKGAGYFICLENAIIKGDVQGYAKMMEIAGEFSPNPAMIAPSESDRKVINVVMPGAVVPPPPPTVKEDQDLEGDNEQ